MKRVVFILVLTLSVVATALSDTDSDIFGRVLRVDQLLKETGARMEAYMEAHSSNPKTRKYWQTQKELVLANLPELIDIQKDIAEAYKVNPTEYNAYAMLGSIKIGEGWVNGALAYDQMLNAKYTQRAKELSFKGEMKSAVKAQTVAKNCFQIYIDKYPGKE